MPMRALLAFSRLIDRLLALLAAVGGWAIVALIAVVCYGVVTRYFSLPKPAGLNSTMIQESQYWLHSYAIVLVIGFAYLRDAHVRIDLLRDRLGARGKLRVEVLGLLVFLLPYAALGVWLCLPYARQSFRTGEISPSLTGLTHLWILKSGLVVLFALLFLAALSSLIRAVAGLSGHLDAAEALPGGGAASVLGPEGRT